MYTQLGVLTKGTVIEVNVSELGMVTAGGKVVFGKYAQVTNNPENDGCINAVLRTSWRFSTLLHNLILSFSCLSEHLTHHSNVNVVRYSRLDEFDCTYVMNIVS